MEILLLPLVIYFTRTNKTFREVHESSRTFEQVTEKDSVGRTIKPTVLLLDSGFVGPVGTQRPLVNSAQLFVVGCRRQERHLLE
ncbi:Protein kinase and PP2C-like domain-containing protein [Trichinella spiralis]|uniref:Protein kinase and PP2C-like domain-containing protein n=1 Tax=Trichinella spiralis TaxID=6334 RepID=A0ABR3KH82_TRISP